MQRHEKQASFLAFQGGLPSVQYGKLVFWASRAAALAAKQAGGFLHANGPAAVGQGQNEQHGSGGAVEGMVMSPRGIEVQLQERLAGLIQQGLTMWRFSQVPAARQRRRKQQQQKREFWPRPWRKRKAKQAGRVTPACS